MSSRPAVRPRAIRVLPDALSNQIAAGEVVERPASVVKELVENALDAGATRIVVEIGEGARDLTVTDDGCGIPAAEAPLALQRFATSKIGQLADLHRIETYGFRGEALPSIASVSRFSLETRPAAQAAGVRIEVEGGAARAESEVGCPAGTRIEVHDLFFNTPARLKFLKSAPTEVRAAVQAVARLALPAEGVAFQVVERGRVAFQTAAGAALRERIGAVLGAETAQAMFAFQGASNGVRARGFAGAPSHARSNARDLLVYVNGRTVKDRTALSAAIEAYRSLLPGGRFPATVVLLEVPSDLVDVNVHPAKTEVRFARTDDVWRAVHRGIESALREAPWGRGEGVRSPAAVPIWETPRWGEGQRPAAWTVGPANGEGPGPEPGAGSATGPGSETGTDSATGSASASATDTGSASAFAASATPDAVAAAVPLVAESPRSYRLIHGHVAAPLSGPHTTPVDRDDPRAFFRSVRIFGQYRATYLLGERNGELVVIDQHAAHERVMFERLKVAAGRGEVPLQRLLVPAVVELPPADARAAAELLPALAKAGIEAEPFGERTIAVRAVPAALAKVEPSALLRDALDEVGRHGRSGTLLDRVDDLFARMACHAAVRAGDRLGPEEVTRLLADMDGIDFAANCPHGRPVVVRFPAAEVEKWFERR